MGIATTVTISSVDYNVYGLTSNPVGDATSYLAGILGAADFAALSADDQARALVSATKWLDRLQWSGAPTDPDTPQPLAFPRTGLPTCRGITYADNIVPDPIVQAMFELAEILAADATAQNSSGQGSNIKKVGAGSAQVEFFQPTINSASDTRLPQVAQDLVACFLAGSATNKATATGTGNSSAFDEDDFDKSGDGFY